MARYDPQLLTREEYLGSDVQYGRQMYGKYGIPLDPGLGDDIDVEVPGEPSQDEGGDSGTGPNVLQMADTSGLSYGLPMNYTSGSYDAYLDSAGKKDRLSGMFSTDDLNVFSKEKVASAIASKALGFPMGLVAPAIVGYGDMVKNAFGYENLRPAGLLGVVVDMVNTRQYDDMAAIKAAQASGTGGGFAFSTGRGGITRAPGARAYTGNMMDMTFEQVKAVDALSKGFTPDSFNMGKETGTTLKEAGWMAASVPWMRDASGASGSVASGYYTPSGSFYNTKTATISGYGSKESVAGFASLNGLSISQAQEVLSQTRAFGNTKTLQEVVNEFKSQEGFDKYSEYTDPSTPTTDASTGAATTWGAGPVNTYEDDDQWSPEPSSSTPSTPSTPSETPSYSDPYDSGYGSDNNNDSGVDSSGADDSGWGGGFGGGYSDWARGGKVKGYAMGTPPAGVQAAQSGFIDAPPSQVSEGAKVADNRPDSVPEGTYILNAAAVEFAGEQDIRKMLMDAQKEAVRRGIVQGDGQRASELVDIAVSSGEVKIAPHLVDIIGEDRLEKINKRGLRKTEERIQRKAVTDSQGRPVTDRYGNPVTSRAFSQGGFI